MDSLRDACGLSAVLTGFRVDKGVEPVVFLGLSFGGLMGCGIPMHNLVYFGLLCSIWSFTLLCSRCTTTSGSAACTNECDTFLAQVEEVSENHIQKNEWEQWDYRADWR